MTQTNLEREAKEIQTREAKVEIQTRQKLGDKNW